MAKSAQFVGAEAGTRPCALAKLRQTAELGDRRTRQHCEEMIEGILIAIIMVDLFALGWLANLPVDPKHPHSECCMGFPDIPDTPDELLQLSAR